MAASASGQRGTAAILSDRVIGLLAPRLPPTTCRTYENMRAAELDGIAFSFRARALAIAVVALWVLAASAWPRNLYYLCYAATFFLLGWLPYRLRHRPHAHARKLAFIALDVALMTTAILMPPPAELMSSWPVQTRLRGQEFLFVLLLLAEAALTYSPLMVLWTGAAIGVIWSAGAWVVYALPDTVRLPILARPRGPEALRLYLDPAFVGLANWIIQVIAAVLFALILALAVWRARRTLLAQCESEVVRCDLARYVSPDVADALAARVHDGSGAGFGAPAQRDVSVLFADLVGFTRAAEALAPEQVFALLRGLHACGCRAVFQHGGTLDKYLGDGFMATFGALADEPDAAARALDCAFALHDEVDRWNADRVRTGQPVVQLSVGLHRGLVVVGNVGAGRRVEFTVVGDVVNVASRLEHATRETGARIVVSDACMVTGAILPAGTVAERRKIALRGRTQPVVAYAIR